jgi:hypothetical protein
MPRLLLLNDVFLLMCASIYLGTGISLVFFQLPIEPNLTIDNYYLIFIVPVQNATRFFTYMTILMLISGAIMLVTEWFSGLRWVPIVVLLAVIAATLLTEIYIFPLNKELEAHVTDPARLKVLFGQWATTNRIRASLWAVQWAAMAYWFYCMERDARADR